jgi:hypothetical protein
MALLVEVGFGDFHPLRVSRSIWMSCVCGRCGVCVAIAQASAGIVAAVLNEGLMRTEWRFVTPRKEAV